VAYLASLVLRNDTEAILVDEQIPVPERPALRQEFAYGGLVGRQGELDRLPRSCHRKSGHGGGGGLSPELRGDAGKRRGV